MQKSNLINIIKSLNKGEIRDLALFIHSDYVNKRPETRLLFNHINKYLGKNNLALTKENAYSAVFPDSPYQEKRIRYTMSFLHKLVEQFLIQKAVLEDEVQAGIYLSQVYQKKGISKAFYKNIQRTEDKLEKSVLRNEYYYENAYQLEFEKYSFSVFQERNAPRNLQELNDRMDLSYLAKKLKISCISLAHQSVYKVDYNKGLLNSILENMEQSTFLEHPTLALYYYYLRAFGELDGAEYYQKFSQTLREHSTLFSRVELRDIYLLAINYCIKKFNLGNEAYLREVFELYQISLRDDLLLENGILSQFSFKNIAGIGLRLKEFDWVAKFIETRQVHLAPKYRDNYVDYTTAKLWYTQQKYKAAMMKLQKVEYDDLFLNLDAKVLLLKIYFELEEYDVLESYISSFQKFVQRKKLIAYHQENYLNTILLTKKMLELNPYDHHAKEQLREKILGTKVLAEREWLLEMLGE